ncbi:MAG TPA: glycosyltransferase family 2 protein [Gaiellaceae bacterium]|nr:glycosyltransferase family 2 protein [Gaiellaceae bacterium]
MASSRHEQSSPETTTPTVRRISVIIPMFNEERNIERVVEDIAAQDFEGDLEVLVADGGSTDRSRELLVAAAERTGVQLTLIQNPKRLVAHGLNACVGQASGDLIARLDCRSRYPANYLRRLAARAEDTDAWNVAAVLEPIGRTAMERAVACAMDSPFGGIAWTRHARGREPVEVDTVYIGAYRRIAFEKVGLFDASVVDNHDEDFNLRVRKAGGTIVLDPTLRVRYTPAGSFRGVFARYFAYGFYKPAVMRKHKQVLSARSLVPTVFLGTLAVLLGASTLLRGARRVLAAEIGLYTAAAGVFGAASVLRRRESLRLLPRVVALFPTFHLAYGTGMVAGWLRRGKAADLHAAAEPDTAPP